MKYTHYYVISSNPAEQSVFFYSEKDAEIAAENRRNARPENTYSVEARVEEEDLDMTYHPTPGEEDEILRECCPY